MRFYYIFDCETIHFTKVSSIFNIIHLLFGISRKNSTQFYPHKLGHQNFMPTERFIET